MLGWAAAALTPAWIGLTLQYRRLTGRLIPPVRPRLFLAVSAGLFIGNAYGLIIHAMRFMPAAYAVAFTNAGIVLAGTIAMSVYDERERWRTRLAALLVICVGLALIALR